MSHRRRSLLTWRAATVAAAIVVASGAALPGLRAAPPPSPTERGLDAFVHVAMTAPGGDVLVVDVQALGYPTATTLAPIPGATVEVTWDPESLIDPTKKEPAPASPPPIVRATADGEGRATLSLPVPRGPTKEITLLVSVRAKDRERTQEINIQRTVSEELELFVSDPRVVPGSELVAWALWTSKDKSKPIARKNVDIALMQGGIARFRTTVQTDAAGAAMARIPIPRDDDPNAQFILRATASESNGAEDSREIADSIELSTREETPGKATLTARFDEGSVVAGGKAAFRVRIHDASGEGIAAHPIWVWTGPRGTEAPKDQKAFEKAARLLKTDGAGEVVADVAAPSTIPPRGTVIQLEVRTEIEGLVRTATSSLEVGPKRGFATLTPEAGELVPGLDQKLTITLEGDDGAPLRGTFSARGDGLDANFTTNDHGEAEVVWKVPKGVGAKRQTGPCPGSVAAQVTLRQTSAAGASTAFGGALVDPSGMALCVPVRREATAFLRPQKLVVREGEPVVVSVIGGEKRAASFVTTQASGAAASASWAADAGAPQSIAPPPGATGVVTVHASLPRIDGAAETVSASVLVVPKRLPGITAKITGGRPVPGGNVRILAELKDETGKPLTGSVAAVVIDKLGGGSFGSLASMDTKTNLCGAVGAEPERCDAALFGGAELDPLRRSSLRERGVLGPVSDPAATAKSKMDATFNAVVRSLEGAVFQSSTSLETLPDVRRKEGKRYVFNPELMTLVTDAMGSKPLTPGGESIALPDLIAVDPQITYDNVARRVTRLKIFNVLTQVRSARAGIDPDEPIFDDPNVFLRSLVRKGSLSDEALLDPWGGQLAFFEGGGDYVPFVSVKKGWQLRSAGPDGKMGTADDVKSPFERVLKSGTPYARALDEDELVDARYDMRVSDETVASWTATFQKATGDVLGEAFGAGGLALGGVGEGGGGSGHGIGLGSVGRVGHGIAKGIAYVSAPIRTDAEGHVVIDIPLGDVETTWQVGLVGLVDDGRPAMSTVDVPVTIPLSAKVNAGARWTEGDAAGVIVQVRNRTAAPIDATLDLAARGAFALDKPKDRPTVRVPEHGVAYVTVPVRAVRSGTGYLDVKTTAPGLPEDTLSQVVDVRYKGELIRIARTAWVESSFDFAGALDRPPFVGIGEAEIVIERGNRHVLEAALDALAPERNLALDELADIAASASEIRRHFIALDGDGSAVAARARAVGRSATAKLAARTAKSPAEAAFVWMARASMAGFVERGDAAPAIPECPSRGGLSLRFLPAALDAEPLPKGGAALDCWTIFVASSVNQLESAGSPGMLARAIVSLAERPHRAKERATLLAKLTSLVKPDDDGRITVPGDTARADLALIYSALLLATPPSDEPKRRARWVQWLLVQRDTNGTFGGAAATYASIRALVREAARQEGPKGTVTVTVDFGDAGKKQVRVAPGERARVAVPSSAKKVDVSPEGAGVMARLERTFLRPYAIPPQPGDNPVSLEVDWPTAPACPPELSAKKACVSELTRGRVANLTVRISASGPTAEVDARIPLPPGVQLADTVAGVRQVQGALYVSATPDATRTLTIPLRFSLSGSFTAREATLKIRDYEADAAIARARPFVVK